ncbi:MAG: MATE family efflux transporter [Phycisphaerales bacterium]
MSADRASPPPDSRPPVPPSLDPGSLDPSEEAVALAPPARRAGAAGRGELGVTPDGRLKSGRLAGLTMNRAIWVLAWPVLVDSLLNTLVGLTDTVLAAGISEPAADAIGMAAYCLWFLGLVIMALDVGATALISRSVGAGRLAVANAAVGQTMLLALAAGVGLGGVLFLTSGALGGLLFDDPGSIDAFRRYMGIMAFDVPFMALLYAGIACVRGAGSTFLPMRVMIVVNLVNMGASWSLAGVDFKTTVVAGGQTVTRTILHNPFGFDLGVTGIAIGTMLGHAVGAVLILGVLARGLAGVRLLRRRLRPHMHTMRRMLRIGFPNFLETLGMWAGNFLVVLIVSWVGAGMVGAHTVAIRIEAFSFQPGFAIAIAAATLAGQYLGAGSPRMARRAILACTLVAGAVMGMIGVVFMLFPHTLVGMLSSQPTHLAVTPELLFITGLVQIPFGIGIVLRQAMRGAGDVKVVMYVTWICTYVLRLPLAYILSGADIPRPAWLGGGPGAVFENPSPWDWGLRGLWIGLCIEIVIRGVLFVARFAHGGWARQRV